MYVVLGPNFNLTAFYTLVHNTSFLAVQCCTAFSFFPFCSSNFLPCAPVIFLPMIFRVLGRKLDTLDDFFRIQFQCQSVKSFGIQPHWDHLTSSPFFSKCIMNAFQMIGGVTIVSDSKLRIVLFEFACTMLQPARQCLFMCRVWYSERKSATRGTSGSATHG